MSLVDIDNFCVKYPSISPGEELSLTLNKNKLLDT